MTMFVCSSADQDAPVLSGEMGGGLNVIKAVLQDGYGQTFTGLGWTEEYAANDIAVYRNSATGTNFYIRIEDNLSGTDNFMNIRGYGAMSDIDTGTDPFPSVAQQADGLVVTKSEDVSSTSRPWLLFGTEKTFYLVISFDGDSSFLNAHTYGFGDFVSLYGSDTNNCFISGNTSQSVLGTDNKFLTFATNIESTSSGFYITKSYTGLGNAINAGKLTQNNLQNMQFPNPVDGGLYIAPILISQNGVLRGVLPGIWYITHAASNFNHGDVFEGTGALADKTFMIIRNYGAVFAAEISDTW